MRRGWVHSWEPGVRKRIAAEEARPLKDQSTAKSQRAAQWNERLKDLKKANEEAARLRSACHRISRRPSPVWRDSRR